MIFHFFEALENPHASGFALPPFPDSMNRSVAFGKGGGTWDIIKRYSIGCLKK